MCRWFNPSSNCHFKDKTRELKYFLFMVNRKPKTINIGALKWAPFLYEENYVLDTMVKKKLNL